MLLFWRNLANLGKLKKLPGKEPNYLRIPREIEG